jgi:hypothetical protein
VHIHDWLVRSKSHSSPFLQSSSSTQVSWDVWQKYPWPQPLPTQGQVAVVGALGEQKPPEPQSASTRQLPPAAQTFGVISELDDRQAQGAPPVQSESLAQVS